MNKCPFFVSFQNTPARYLNEQNKMFCEYTLCCEYIFDRVFFKIGNKIKLCQNTLCCEYTFDSFFFKIGTKIMTNL